MRNFETMRRNAIGKVSIDKQSVETVTHLASSGEHTQRCSCLSIQKIKKSKKL
jgi:hypothetical protein